MGVKRIKIRRKSSGEIIGDNNGHTAGVVAISSSCLLARLSIHSMFMCVCVVCIGMQHQVTRTQMIIVMTNLIGTDVYEDSHLCIGGQISRVGILSSPFNS